MLRFCGLMPPAEIEISKHYKDGNGLGVTIDAGPKGWTVLWSDYGLDYRDEIDTSENNFKKAYEFAVKAVGALTEV